MTVTVVIPTYNRPEYLEGAIETALQQTYDDLTVVVVDDGSADPYASEIVADFPERVTCIHHEQNRGLSAARNTGVRESDGEYVAFLDDDDRWHETKLARQVGAIEGNEQAGLATCLVASISPSGEILHCENSAPSGDCSKDMLVGNRIGTPSRILVRRSCFESVGGFDQSLPTKQDWDFYLRTCQDWQVVAVEDPLCFRTVHESMSSSPTATERDKKAILNKHKNLIRENGCWEQARAKVFKEIGRSYLGASDFSTARTYLWKSFQLVPTKRCGVMLLLSFTNSNIFNEAINVKRTLSLKVNDAYGGDLNLDAVPGLQNRGDSSVI
ncbi:glycosyltransferase family 2 protein [Halorussus salinisoli]|uniref:glycosyltransferase family 2 protein n=1 Tax=Halorussus salinisoli TaxID=2558242 RepID=UPI0010C18C86|nr:glycosyltransferase family A protein [Halorussus salinisoli]